MSRIGWDIWDEDGRRVDLSAAEECDVLLMFGRSEALVQRWERATKGLFGLLPKHYFLMRIVVWGKRTFECDLLLYPDDRRDPVLVIRGKTRRTLSGALASFGRALSKFEGRIT